MVDKPGLGPANAQTYLSGCTTDGRPQVNMDFWWKSIDAFRRSNKGFSEEGIVLHEAVHAQGYLSDGNAWWDGLYGVDPAVTNSVERASEYYQDVYDGTPGRVHP